MLHPENLYIGCEAFVNGVGALLGVIDEKEIKNIRIHHGDARHFMDDLPDLSLDEVYLLYPDPWPKARHAKRRFIQDDHFKIIHQLLKLKGIWKVASDHPCYQEWIDLHLQKPLVNELFGWSNEGYIDQPWDEWHRTRYEAKALREGRVPQYYVFQKID
jgi:tRNA (guanine-N7-)-methyltransferase